jgi:hypothetical protein
MPGSRSTMANPIKPKRRTSDATPPVAAALQDGEIAVNVPSRTIYINNGGTVVPIANFVSAVGDIGGLQAALDAKLDANATAVAAAKLSAPRALTIGGTVRNFDGTAGLSWSLADIGAAAAVHTHAIADVTGLQPAINAKLDATATALAASKLATARNLTIGSTARAFDGTVALSWTLGEIGAAAAVHTHAAADITSGTLAAARLGSGTASNQTFLLGNSTFSNTLNNNLVLSTPSVSAVDRVLNIGYNGGVVGDADRNNYIDLFSANTTDPTNYQARFIRWAGANGALDITQRGTGQVRLYSTGASNIVLGSSGQNKLIYTASTDLWSLGANGFANGFAISGAAGSARRIQYRTGANARFEVGLDGTAEGVDTGSNFVFNVLTDAGVSTTTAYIIRQTGAWAFNVSPTVPTATAGDSSTKAASTAFVGTAVATSVPLTQKGVANGVATLDSAGKVPTSQLPPLAINDVFPVASQAAMLALTAEVGDVAIRSDINKTFILSASPASTLANWAEVLSPSSAVASVFGRTGAIVATTGDYTAAQITQDASNRFVTDAEKATWNGKQAALGYTPVNRAGDTGLGSMTFASGSKILGDFTNATITSRTILQSSTVNGITIIGAAPNGTGTTTLFQAYNSSDLANAGQFQFRMDATLAILNSTKLGTGVLRPISFQFADIEKASLDVNGNLTTLGSMTSAGLVSSAQVRVNANGGSLFLISTADGTKTFGLGNSWTAAGDGIAFLHNYANTDMVFGTNNTERGRVLAGGALSWGVGGISTTGSISATGAITSTGSGGGLFWYNRTGTARGYAWYADSNVIRLNVGSVGDVATFSESGDFAARRGDFTGRMFVKDSGGVNPGTPAGKCVQLYYMSTAIGDWGTLAAFDYTAGAYKPLRLEGSSFQLRGNGATSFGMDIDGNGAYLYSGWFRTYGAAGWYSQDYAGGIYMSDSTYVRVYGGKTFWAPEIRVESTQPTISFYDTDQATTHWIHCNSNQIGFLQNNAFAWAAYRDASNNWGCVGNVYGAASDERLKTNFRPFDAAAIDAAFDAIELEVFDWNELGNQNGFHEKDVLGSSAQKMQRAIPAAVTINHALNPIEGEKPDYLTIMWDKTVPTLIGKVKNQQREIDELKALVRGLMDKAA